jgi:hypothetical protein
MNATVLLRNKFLSNTPGLNHRETPPTCATWTACGGLGGVALPAIVQAM